MDSALLSKWDHTSQLQAQLQSLGCIVIGLVNSSGPKPLPSAHFHPYRKVKKSGPLIQSKEDFKILKAVGDSVAGNR